VLLVDAKPFRAADLLSVIEALMGSTRGPWHGSSTIACDAKG
jgi:hypothetical protein